jgi:hypothetical protein
MAPLKIVNAEDIPDHNFEFICPDWGVLERGWSRGVGVSERLIREMARPSPPIRQIVDLRHSRGGRLRLTPSRLSYLNRPHNRHYLAIRKDKADKG